MGFKKTHTHKHTNPHKHTNTQTHTHTRQDASFLLMSKQRMNRERRAAFSERFIEKTQAKNKMQKAE